MVIFDLFISDGSAFSEMTTNSLPKLRWVVEKNQTNTPKKIFKDNWKSMIIAHFWEILGFILTSQVSLVLAQQ